MMRLYLKLTLALVSLTLLFSTTFYAQITADFTVSPNTEICQGIAVGVTATINSPNPIDTIKWDFGENGFEIGSTNSGYIYHNPGLFTVRLVVIDVMGNTDTTTKVDFMTVNPTPDVDFTVSNNLGCVPFNSTLSFVTSSVVAPSWTWTWVITSDSTCLDSPVKDTLVFSNGNPFNYTFTQAGIYDIELTVENQLNCESQKVKNNIVVAKASPTSGFSFVANSNCMGATDVTFTSTSTLTCTTTPFYIWDFAEGPTMTTTNLNISHQYTIPGVYPVQLITNDGTNNCVDTIIQNITITAQDTVDFDYTPQGGCEGTTIQFNDLSSGNPVGWSWDFGDGNNSTQQNPAHTYAVAGCYFVTLVVDYGGCSITKVTPTCITIDPIPTISYNIIGSTLSCFIPLTVSFAPVITNAPSPIITWYFGNGDSSSVLAPSYTYTESGIYPITLKVVNSFGCETIVSTDTIIIDELTIGFQADFTTGCAPLAVTFTDTSTSLSPIVNWNWDFGNGMSSLDSIPTITYTTINDFDVALSITNASGCSAADTYIEYVSIGQTPNINFFASDTVICPGESISFSNLSDPNLTNVVWLLNDSLVSTDLNPTLNFPTGGMFSIGMAATINNCRDTLTKTGYIRVRTPTANFDTDIDCSNQLQVVITDNSIGAVDWSWAFGDPNTTMDTSSTQNPIYTYVGVGSYDIILTITDIFGCTDSTQETINLQNPIAGFGYTPDVECIPAGNIIGLTDTSEYSIVCEWIIVGNEYFNGTAASSCTPEIYFDTAGTYTLTQVVFAENGCTDTTSHDICITDVFPFGFVDPNDPNTRDTTVLDFTDSLGNTITGCLIQIDSNTGDTLLIDSLSFPPVDCNAPQQFVTGCVPMTVSFMDTSSASPDSIVAWLWNFGDGTTDTVQNPTHTYTTVSNANAFIVIVSAINTYGAGQTDTLNYFIRTTQPSAGFIPNRTLACEGQNITFDNRSEGVNLSYNWDFGNGDTRTERSPVYAFPNEGNYQVCLTVTDGNGCDSMYCDSISIINPVAAFTADTTYSACANLEVTYSNTSLNSVSYLWDFGNDTTSTDTMPSVIYSGTGFYTVTLFATGGSGCIDTLEKVNLIRVDGPQVTSFTLNPTDSCVSHKVQFNIQGDNIASIKIEYGNGMDTTLLTNTSNVIDTTVEYTYHVDGVYDPVLRVVDSLNCERVFNFNTIRTTDPKAVFHMTTLGGCAPYFALPNADSSEYAASYQWFAEGATSIIGSTLSNPTIRYNNAGFFDTIQLVITDVNGCQDTTYFTDTVTVSDAYAGFTQDVVTDCSPLPVSFMDTSSAFPGTIMNWAWNFGDGTTDTLQNPTHIFNGTPNQNYTVTLTTTSTDGCTNVVSIPILPTLPQTFFTADSLACTGQTIDFTNQTTGLGLTYLWNFGDGNTSTDISPTHFYATEDTFVVCLTATDENGCDSTFCINRIIVGDPVANFTEDKVFIACPPDTVQFTDQSAFAAQWEWTIEGVNPTTRTTQNTAAVYTVPGLYDVQLIITSGSGCRDTMLKEEHILIDGPYGTLDFTPDEGCIPLQVDFLLVLDNTVNVIIDKGDGTLPDFISNPSDTLRYSYTYTSGGNFTPIFFIQDALGCQREVGNGNIFVTEPHAIFDIQPDTFCLPFSSTVINNSQDVSTFEWDYLGASINNMNLLEPTFTFPDTGYYPIELKVTDIFGCSDSLTKTVVASDIFPSIGASTTTGCRPLVVQFSDLTAVFPDDIVNWQWDFGDGNTSTVANPSHTYLNNGIYTVSLVVTNSLGCSDSIAITDFIEVTFPIVDYAASRAFACTGQQIDFTNASSGENITYQWDFGNGDIAIAQDTSYTYQIEGVYNVCLTVIDRNNCDTMHCKTITIANPVANFSSNVQYIVCPPANIQFTDLSANATAWAWSFGDGGTSTDQNPAHTYTTTGFYDVQLIVTGLSGCIDTLFRSQYIEVGGPTGSFNFSTNAGCAPLGVDFNAIGNNIRQYTWRFGNGDSTVNITNQPTDMVSYTYTTAGTFYPELTIYDSTGCPLTLMVDSVEVDTLQFDFIVSDSILCETGTVNFTHSIQSSSPIDSILWEFEGAGITSSTANSPNISYNVMGDYDVTLTVYSRHCTKTITKTDFIKIAPIPNNAMVISPSQGCIPTTVNFTDASTIANGNITNWAWSFGEGTLDSNQNVAILYDTVGTFDVQLITVSDFGCSDTLLYADTITIHPLPVSLFTSDTFACTNQMVNFTNLSTGGNLTYTWDFGDGNISTDFEPTHTYTTEDTFTVCLTITDSNTCVHVYCSDVVIANPVANFTADTTYKSCPFDSIQFIDQSLNAVAWTWTFGDGDTSILQNPSHTYTATGFYDVQLIVTSASGCMDTLLQTQYIEIGGPTGSFSFSTNSGCGPLAVQFDAVGSNIRQYTWRFGNGDSTVNITNQPTDNISYTYTGAGTFFPSLTIYDSTGCALDLMLDSIEVDTLSFDFTADQTLLCETGLVTFTPTINSSNSTDALSWEFENGTPSGSIDSIPVILYDSLGFYTISLQVISGHCAESVNKFDYIHVAPNPSPNFGTLTSPICSDQTLDFIDISTIVSGNNVGWQWAFGDGDSSFVQSPTHVYADSGSYQVNLEVISDFGCTVDTTIDVFVNLTPNAASNEPDILCIGESATLTATGGVSYLWTSTGIIPCDTCSIITVSPVVTTDYILQTTSAEGCQNIDTVTVEVSIYSVPDLTVSNDTTICTGDIIQLFAGGGNSVLDYVWDDTRAGLSCYEHCSNPFASPDSTTIYPVTLTGPGGCQAMDSITVTVIDQSTDLLGPDRTICLGDSIQLQVPQGSNPVWSPTTGLSCVFCANPYIFPMQTRTYAVQVTTAGGCVITDSITINVVQPADISAGPDATICTNTSIQLSGFGNGIISWSNAVTLSDSSILNPTAMPTTTTDYILTIENDVCVLSDTVTITVADKVEIEGEDYEICEGESVLLTPTGFAQRFEWLPNEQGFLQQSPTIVQPTTSTTYALVGEIDNCANDTAYFNITVNEIPNIDLLDFQSAYIGLGTPLPVNNPNPNYTYTWLPSNGLSCVDCPTPLIFADSTTNGSIITVDVTSPEGCSYMDSVQITVISGCGEDIVQLPTAFTPNDDGRNDILYVRGNGIQTIEVFRVYNRWGQLMFESNELSDGWDGKYKGQLVPSEVYVYYVVASCPITGEQVIKRGDVMVQY